MKKLLSVVVVILSVNLIGCGSKGGSGAGGTASAPNAVLSPAPIALTPPKLLSLQNCQNIEVNEDGSVDFFVASIPGGITLNSPGVIANGMAYVADRNNQQGEHFTHSSYQGSIEFYLDGSNNLGGTVHLDINTVRGHTNGRDICINGLEIHQNEFSVWVNNNQVIGKL